MQLRYSVFGTIGQSLAVWARNLPSILILGLIFFSPLIVYIGHEVMEVRDAGGLSEDRGVWWILVIVFATYAADQFLAAPIVYGVVQELNGTRAGVGACVWQGLKRFVPVFFTVFLLYWCVMFGAYPFVIPAFVLATGLYVAVPAAVCERPGVMGTLTRSFALTEGNRMRIFGLMILFWGTRVGAKVAAITLIDPQGHAGKIQALLVTVLVIDFLYGTIGAVIQGVTYSRLRQLRDGVSTADLARVFE
ncbi:MAG: hypothetical protein HS111_30020 [Kofleriaceae bacterium]|nr:hypothetical protein [Kofleriaceae bacterium]MCL4223927.1 hypothetical protein [Myxococcales bacterium]